MLNQKRQRFIDLTRFLAQQSNNVMLRFHTDREEKTSYNNQLQHIQTANGVIIKQETGYYLSKKWIMNQTLLDDKSSSSSSPILQPQSNSVHLKEDEFIFVNRNNLAFQKKSPNETKYIYPFNYVLLTVETPKHPLYYSKNEEYDDDDDDNNINNNNIGNIWTHPKEDHYKVQKRILFHHDNYDLKCDNTNWNNNNVSKFNFTCVTKINGERLIPQKLLPCLRSGGDDNIRFCFATEKSYITPLGYLPHFFWLPLDVFHFFIPVTPIIIINHISQNQKEYYNNNNTNNIRRRDQKTQIISHLQNRKRKRLLFRSIPITTLHFQALNYDLMKNLSFPIKRIGNNCLSEKELKRLIQRQFVKTIEYQSGYHHPVEESDVEFVRWCNNQLISYLNQTQRREEGGNSLKVNVDHYHGVVDIEYYIQLFANLQTLNLCQHVYDEDEDDKSFVFHITNMIIPDALVTHLKYKHKFIPRKNQQQQQKDKKKEEKHYFGLSFFKCKFHNDNNNNNVDDDKEEGDKKMNQKFYRCCPDQKQEPLCLPCKTYWNLAASTFIHLLTQKGIRPKKK